MRSSITHAFAAILVLIPIGIASEQLAVQPESRMWIEGSSTIRHFQDPGEVRSRAQELIPLLLRHVTASHLEDNLMTTTFPYRILAAALLDFPATDIRNGGRFQGFMVEGVVAF